MPVNPSPSVWKAQSKQQAGLGQQQAGRDKPEGACGAARRQRLEAEHRQQQGERRRAGPATDSATAAGPGSAAEPASGGCSILLGQRGERTSAGSGTRAAGRRAPADWSEQPHADAGNECGPGRGGARRPSSQRALPRVRWVRSSSLRAPSSSRLRASSKRGAAGTGAAPGGVGILIPEPESHRQGAGHPAPAAGRDPPPPDHRRPPRRGAVAGRARGRAAAGATRSGGTEAEAGPPATAGAHLGGIQCRQRHQQQEGVS